MRCRVLAGHSLPISCREGYYVLMREDETVASGELDPNDDLKGWVEAHQPATIEFSDPFPLSRDYVPEEVLISESGQLADYSDMRAINLAIDKLRLALYKTSDHLKEAERRSAKSKLDYERAYNRNYLLSEGKTDSVRKAIAQIKSEKLENKWRTRDMIVRELNSRLRMMSIELDALKTLAYNMRKEIESAR